MTLDAIILTLTLPAEAIFGPIQSKIDAADNSYCQETSLTGHLLITADQSVDEAWA